MSDPIDLFVIGGGINGVGIARDAAGRGYSVTLAEMNDLASATSGWSSKLIHGGVRYLEHYEFMLVRKALKEREVLWNTAPHIVQPMRFVLPHHKDLRPAWLLRLGLFLYDHIGGRKLLPPTKVVDLQSGIYGKPLRNLFTKGFQYSDCQVDDSRLVILNAMDAVALGGRVLTRTKVISARRDGPFWRIRTRDERTGKEERHFAKMLINASGPWVDEVLNTAIGMSGQENVRPVKGSHIVVPAMFDHDNAYIFQNADERIIFAIPWQNKTTLIGTTDHDFSGDLENPEISDEEITYLCEAASEYFKEPITRDQIVWTYAGIRPLYDDGASAAKEATRDYVFKTDGVADNRDKRAAPLINIFGGKITTYRELALRMMDEVEQRIGRKGRPWTHSVPLPGGDFPATGFDALFARMKKRYTFLEDTHLRRMCHSHGTRVEMVLGNSSGIRQLGDDFGHGLYEVEVRYLITNEFAETADDILWRRTKLGLEFSVEEAANLQKWLDEEA